MLEIETKNTSRTIQTNIDGKLLPCLQKLRNLVIRDREEKAHVNTLTTRPKAAIKGENIVFTLDKALRFYNCQDFQSFFH